LNPVGFLGRLFPSNWIIIAIMNGVQEWRMAGKLGSGAEGHKGHTKTLF
jgi:hypothetical protein